MEDLERRSQPEEFTEHQDIVCGVVEGDGSKDLTGRQESLLRQLSDDGPQSIDGEAREQLKELVLAFEDTFAMDENELGCAQDVAQTIDTGDHQPIRQPPRHVPFALRGEVEQMVEKMLGQGVIQPSKSPWASPIVLVAKKDGTTQFCVDYRKLNAVTKMDVYPLPRIDDTLDLLANNQYFSTLDLASGYWQVQMDSASQEKTAFTTHVGLYEFKVMPFGLCNAPATFQRLIENVLHGLVGRCCLVYLDDVIVLGKTVENHLANLRAVWSRLRKAGLRLKPSKCNLFKQEVNYLGYVVSVHGVATDPEKVSAMERFPTPIDLKSLRSFLGLASYYRRFVPNFSVIANPLFALTRKDAAYNWDQPCQQAFDRLKMYLATAPVLAYPDFSVDFQLETDASGMGLGAVLSQTQKDRSIRPIAFASRTLQASEVNYGITELEALAVVWAVRHFRQYLYGHRCNIITDHEVLKSLLNTPHPSGRLARWGLTLQELDLVITYCPGKKNPKADALSRYPVCQDQPDESSLGAVVAQVGAPPNSCQGQEGEQSVEDSLSLAPSQGVEQSAPGDTLERRQRSDPELLAMILYLENNTLPEDDQSARTLVLHRDQYSVVGGVLYHLASDKTLRVVVPESDRMKLVQQSHGGKFGGHLGDAKVYGMLCKHYWWPRMRKDVARWCKSCLACATWHVGRSVKPLLTPISVGGPFDRVGVDVVQLPVTKKGHKYAVVFMDYLTKWPEVFPTKDQTAPTIAKLLVEEIICRHGVPTEQLSDRGPNFLSGLMQEI